MDKPKIIEGKYHFDNRGSLRFFNDISLLKYKRFYDVSNYKNNFIRAWHGHKKESKMAIVRQGAAIFGLVKIDKWDKPSKNLNVKTFVMDYKSPSVLVIPKGYANGFMNLKSNTSITFYSDKALNESLDDDYRYDYDYWNIWNIEYK